MPNFYGLMTVKGRFERFDGTLELGAHPTARLTVDATSVDTGNARRDKHLRSGDFFDVEHHPSCASPRAALSADGDSLKLRGALEAVGEQVPIELDATVRTVDGELEVEAVTHADQRRLGMTWSPLRLVGAPTKLILSRHG